MAGRKKKQEIMTTITSEEHFMQFYNEQNKKLVVVDIYPGWSGPCTAMYPTYNQLMLSIDDFEKRIDILLLDQDKLVNYKSDKFSSTCKPKFLFISDGKIIDVVEGTNVPVFVDRELLAQVVQNRPEDIRQFLREQLQLIISTQGENFYYQKEDFEIIFMNYDFLQQDKLLDCLVQKQTKNNFQRNTLSIRINIIKFGEKHIESAETLENIAVVQLKQEKHEEALEKLQKVFQIKKKKYGENSINIAGTLHNISIALIGKKDIQGALKISKNALVIAKNDSMASSFARTVEKQVTVIQESQEDVKQYFRKYRINYLFNI
ncbi:thioredoxin domain protein 3 [Ichthyophthirius multifiliis]|uniref:Thioredoxin domain protein 3 n=1 Tax=Ichthyophthirius multifiliis TaxID=5932 RepID=G0QQ38_ICHMU|nr:thioredoxin domain protein 3 [Ichthyophthirius multifiliis]EGR32666.1 thioredoxin domain protein 3 [Ichthyophthirius multifiliis]|eukprot:XP_004036652.1 thioredoxin domain protein 3 [Ichthyophthirius multifiliis]